MKKIINFLKRFVLSFLIIYGYNLIAINFNMIIPINILNILIITIFGAPSLVVLILLKMIMM